MTNTQFEVLAYNLQLTNNDIHCHHYFLKIISIKNTYEAKILLNFILLDVHHSTTFCNGLVHSTIMTKKIQYFIIIRDYVGVSVSLLI